MGGRGSESHTASNGPIGDAKPISVTNEKHKNNFRWDYTVLEAKSGGGGSLIIGYPKPDSYENPNRNTTVAHYELKAGFYNEPGHRSLRTHNVDLSKATSVSGETYAIKDMLKAEGFKWDRNNKRWVR